MRCGLFAKVFQRTGIITVPTSVRPLGLLMCTRGCRNAADGLCPSPYSMCPTSVAIVFPTKSLLLCFLALDCLEWDGYY